LRAEPTTAPRADRRWRWVVPSAVALLLLVALVLALGGDRDGTPGRPGPTSTRRAAPSASATTVGVPADLVGKSREDAAAAVRKAGLDPRVESRAHAASPGTVVEVRPTAGARLQRGDEVTLVVSSGSDRTDGGVGTEDGKDEEKDDDKGKGKGDDKKKDG
ncbi:MAG TPA: PASTA domain-containing protein, partial [Mycobacteriales bacterium]|nr:PASTA domain-containing protein [Mycobacteriales bacterium]